MAFAAQSVLITGGSRGIGRGIALKLAQKGRRIAINYYQNEAAAKDTAAKLRARGAEAVVIKADVCHADEVSGMVERVKKEFGALDVFVSNARPEVPAFYQTPMEITLDHWDAAIDSQAKAFLVGAREASKLMQNGGRIIAITYAPGGKFGSWQPWVAMGSAKLAMESLCRYFAVALGKRGITVNAISPGWIDDSVLNSLPPAVQKTIKDWHEGGWTPMRRLGTPADIGNAVALLCSDEAGWITGQTIAVDGGSSLMDAALPLEIQQAI